MKAAGRTQKNRFFHYGLATFSVALALGLTLLLSPWLYPTVTPLFFVAVLVSAWLGGWEAGLLATVLSVLAIGYSFIEPLYSLGINNLGSFVRLSLFAIAAVFITWLTHSRRAALQEVRANYQALKETMERAEAARVESKQAQEALWQSEARFQTVAANLPKGAVFIVDQNLRYLLAAGEALQEAGFKVEDFVGKTLSEALDPALAAYYEPYYRQALNGEPFSLEHDSHDRSYSSHGTPLYNAHGEVYGVLAMSYDISERKQTEASLRKSEEKYRTLFEAIDEGFCIIELIFDPDLKPIDYRFVQTNPAFIKLTGLPQDSLGKTARQLMPDLEEFWFETYGQVALTGEAVRFENHAQSMNRWFDVYASRIGDATSHRVAIVFNNITDRKQSEAALQRAANFSTFCVALTDALRPLADPVEVQATASQLLGEYLGANRVAYFEVRGNSYVVERDYVNDANSLAGSYPVAAFGTNVLSALRSGCAVTAADVAADPNLSPAQRSAYAALQIGAHIAIPLVKDGQLIAGLTVQAAEPRAWTTDQVALAAEVAERTWAAVERARAEAALRESESQLKLASESAKLGLWFWNLETDTLTWTEQCKALFGLPAAADMSYEIFLAALHPDDRQRTQAAVTQSINDQVDYDIEYRTRWPDGTVHWIAAKGSCTYDPTGKPIQMMGLALDITDRKQAEAELQESKVRLDFVLEAAQFGGWDLDLKTQTAHRSLKHDQIFGYQSLLPEWTYRMFLSHVLAEDRAEADRTYQSAVANNQAWNLECRIYRADQQVRWIWVLGYVYVNAQGEATRMIGLVSDITDRKQAEAQREQLLEQEQSAREAAEQANRIKDEFLAVLSHELRSPLNPILGWSKLLQKGKLNEAKTKQALTTIERNAQLQAELIDDLLDVARILRGKLSLTVSAVNLTTTIHSAIETVRLAAEAKSITIKPNLEPELGSVAGDPTRLQQVVWNLLSNAVKFTPAGGWVEVHLEQVEHQAQLTVRDNGKGIAPEFLPHVFEYFRQEDGTTTRKFGGLGLGLAIVRQIVELHGGRIWVESPGEGLGATFTVQLPLMPTQASANVEPESAATLNLNGIQVLVVDDEADSREFIGFVVEQAGATVKTAASAAEAIAILKSGQFDILLSDIGMPELDGYAFMQYVRGLPSEQNGQIRAIALTAYAGDFNQQKALQAGFQQHVAKPVEPEVLVNMISSLVNRKVNDQRLEKREV